MATATIGAVQERTLEKVKQTFEGIKEAFLREKNNEAFLPTKKLIGSSTNWIGWTILRSLVADSLLERVVQPAVGVGGKMNAFRLTQGGWALLSQIHDIPAKELYDHYMDPERAKRGSTPYAPRKPTAAVARKQTCSICRDDIQSRRVDATVCWGCEQQGQRIARGMDHVPRTAAYLKVLKPLAARKEQARVDAVIAEHRARFRANGAPDEAPSNGRQAVSQPISLQQLGALHDRISKIDEKIDRLLAIAPRLGERIVVTPRAPKTRKEQVLAAIAAALEKL